MTTKAWAVGLMILTTIFTSVAQVFYKFGAAKLEFSFISLITNYQLIIGVVLYVLGAVIMITAFRGGEVSVLYPIIATSYIWVSLMSIWFFKESVGFFRWVGVFVIIAGIVLVNLGSKKTIEYVDVI